jgi:hypothetical protein
MGHRFAISIGATVAALALAGTAVAAGTCFGVKRSATLTGATEIPAGDSDGSGRAVIGLNVSEGLVCWSMTVKGIAVATASHIHKAPAGTAGPVVVPLGTPASGASKGCTAAARSLIRDILANPGEYYVNVHNKDFPAGAVRGQLGA